MVDNYRTAKRRGKYLLLTTETEAKSHKNMILLIYSKNDYNVFCRKSGASSSEVNSKGYFELK